MLELRWTPRLAWAVVFSLSISIAIVGSKSALHAAEFRVGAGGTHATIQSAIDEALASPGDDLIKVRAGDYPEDLSIPGLRDGLVIEGHYLADFATRDPRRFTTRVVGAAGSSRSWMAEVSVQGGTLHLDLHFWGNEVGGRNKRGLSLAAGPGSTVYLNCYTRSFEAGSAGELRGIGSAIELDGASLTGFCDADENAATNPEATVQGGGLYLRARGASRVHGGNTIRDNRIAGRGHAAALIVIEGTGNEIDWRGYLSGNGSASASADPGASEDLAIEDRGSGNRFEMRQLFSWSRRGRSGALALTVGAGSEFVVTDSIVDKKDAVPTVACKRCDGTLHLTNLTVVGGPIRVAAGSGEVSIANTIVAESGAGPPIEIAPAPEGPRTALSNNLIGVDPLFAGGAPLLPGHAPPFEAYRLLPGSLGIDAGNESPPGGLGFGALPYSPRVLGLRVDIGSAEAAASSVGGHGVACTVGDRTLGFLDRWAPACRCFRDVGLRTLRCGFFLPEMFLSGIIPIPRLPDEPIDPLWVLHPWQGAVGPYRISVELLRDGKWVSAKGLGPQSGRFALDKVTQHRFALRAPAADAPMRARIDHLAPGPEGPERVEDVVYLLVDMPEAGKKP